VRKDIYLNVVLTILAVLLSVDLWTRIAEQPFPDQALMAQSRSSADRKANRTKPVQRGVSSIGTESIGQRARMIELLGQIHEQFGGLKGLLESGGIKVQVAEAADTSKKSNPRRR
jgi:hypothetical protein